MPPFDAYGLKRYKSMSGRASNDVQMFYASSTEYEAGVSNIAFSFKSKETPSLKGTESQIGTEQPRFLESENGTNGLF